MTVTRPPANADQTPAGNWLRMHRGWGDEPKIRHRTWPGAWWHLHGSRKRVKVDADLLWVYPCWFTDGNTFGRKHYHVGHVPKLRKLFDPTRSKPRPGTLFLGVFAVSGGFEVRTFDTKPATCLPARPTVAEALREYPPPEKGALWNPGAAAWAATSISSPVTPGPTRSTSSRSPGG
jgi:hypothetical protein